MKKIIEKYKERFELPDEDGLRDTFAGELRYECGKIFYVVFLVMAMWIPYIYGDLSMHQYPALVISIRFMFTFTGLCVILLRFTKYFKPRPDLSLKILSMCIHVGFAVIVATAGEAIPTYISGFTFLIMVFSLMPFSFVFKIISPVISLIVFIVSGFLFGMDFSNIYVRFGINDLLSFTIVFIILAYIYNQIKYRTWEQSQKLKRVIVENEANLITMSNLAEKAEKSDRAKSEFLAAMSHEIRTPLNAIIGISQIELQKDTVPDEYAEAFNNIFESGADLLGIINDVLDMSKVETGKMELINAEYLTPKLINDTVLLNTVKLNEKKSINFILSVDENLPSKLIGDELRLKQILNNLLSNAIKYTDNGFVRFSVEHTLIDDYALLKFTIEDSGQGIKSEDIDKLFTKFQRFNYEDNYAIEGTGLGLSITKRLIEMMEGTIEIKSEYGRGSIFSVAVRQEAVKCNPIGAQVVKQLYDNKKINRRRSEKEKTPCTPMPYGRVLIVDDINTNLKVAKGLLRKYELIIDTAQSGYEVLEKVENGEAYDIIFMDHMMPKISGIETTQELRKKGYKGIIVALTANALVGNKEKYQNKGFNDYITKPINTKALDDVLKKYIHDRHG